MILIFIDKHSNAFSYITSVLMEDVIDGFQIVHDWDSFVTYAGPKICYDSQKKTDGSFRIVPSADIWHNGEFKRHAVQLDESGCIPFIFPTKGDLKFDVFAASFYVISRYEEYLPHDADHVGRFSAKNSTETCGNLYKKPVVDIWRNELIAELQKKWPQIQLKKRSFEMIATIDVDSAFAYCHKGFGRTLGGIGRDFSRFDWKNMLNRLCCLFGKCDDPFKTYNYIASHVKSVDLKLIFFFLLADFTKYDINVTHKSKQLRQTILDLSKKFEIGIHPGISSHSKFETLINEKNRLEEITGQKCTQSRQHYLKVNLPQTYRRLIDADIHDDYSMGYADDSGFRAGTCRPFKWFDLLNNSVTNLTVHSVMVMDATLNSYLKLSPADAIEYCNELIREVKNVNGIFISIWHNDTLAERGIWKGWRAVWENLIRNH